jgi:two-component system, OmpR family, sensor histidine kinase KdpD
MPAPRELSRGRLRIYLGAAAGVGKTYEMLGDARLAHEEGVDLVVGYLEPHGRTATEERARGLEMAPTISFGSGGRAETEPDIDWLVARRPAVALLDELAHSNAGGPRAKRHEDAEYLLARGIDVWTTVNVQHVESLKDRVQALTGIEVRETLPDRVLHGADEIRLVDLAPGALRERIAEGLVYPEERIDRALTGFFTIQNLTALRALVLHELAEMAAAQLSELDPDQDVRPNERVLVATSGRSGSATRLIRAGARLARRADGELYVLVVEPEDGRIDQNTESVLHDAAVLTASLGGSFLRRRAPDAAAAIVGEIEAQGITQLVLGESKRRGLKGMIGGGPIAIVLRRTRGVDVHVVADPALP